MKSFIHILVLIIWAWICVLIFNLIEFDNKSLQFTWFMTIVAIFTTVTIWQIENFSTDNPVFYIKPFKKKDKYE